MKLNNIEYAMQELDKLEKSMNPDACAALLEKIEGPKKKTKRPSKYTFTIKVVEAEDLKACDPSGFSDPYVVFGDELQKRLYKTRIIYRNLNPRWDESFDVTVQSPVNVIATIWDYDTFGDHDYVGRTSIKLDPLYFDDYLPREFWLDLDSQGRMLIRVSMEGERDDIQFHFGKAFRHLKRTERDMVRKITDKVSRPRLPRTRPHIPALRWIGRNTNTFSAYITDQRHAIPRDTAECARNWWYRVIGHWSLEEEDFNHARDLPSAD